MPDLAGGGGAGGESVGGAEGTPGLRPFSRGSGEGAGISLGVLSLVTS